MKNTYGKVLAMALLATSLSLAAGAQSIKTVIGFPNATAGIAANPVTNKIYVVAPTVDGATDNLAVIDGNKDVFLRNIAVPSGASTTAVDYITNRIYVGGCNFNETPSPCVITVIDGNKNSVLSTIPITTTPGFGITGIAVNPLTCTVYVANASDNVVDIVKGIKPSIVGTISLNGQSPAAIAINPILNRLYIPFGTNLTAVVDATKRQMLSTTSFGNTTVGAAVNLVTGNVFVTDAESGPSTTGVLDKNGVLLASVPVGDTPFGVDVDPVTNLAFVASTALNTITVIDGSTNTVKANVFGIPASFVAVNLATEKVYVSGSTGVTVLTEK